MLPKHIYSGSQYFGKKLKILKAVDNRRQRHTIISFETYSNKDDHVDKQVL